MGDENKDAATKAQPQMTIRQCYEAKRAEIDAVPQEQLKKLTLDITEVVMTLAGVQPKIERFREQIVRELPATNMRYFDDIEVYVGALHHAHRMHGLLLEEDAPIAQMADDLAQKHQLLYTTAELVAQMGLMNGAVLPELKARTSNRVLTLHTLKLCELLRLSWKAIENKTVLSPQMLDDIEMAAVRLTHSIGERDQRLAALSESAETRLRIYTLTLNAYSEVRRAIGYIRWYQGDADIYAPALSNPRGRGSREKEDEPAPDADVTKPSPNDQTATGGASPVAPVVPAPAAPATGPNGAPFTR